MRLCRSRFAKKRRASAGFAIASRVRSCGRNAAPGGALYWSPARRLARLDRLRSDRRRDIGHVWENLYRFVRVEIPPFTEREAANLIEVAVASGKIQPDAIRHSADLYRISRGLPHILQELITELATREYNLSSVAGLRLLELDRKIHRLGNFERPTLSEGEF